MVVEFVRLVASKIPALLAQSLLRRLSFSTRAAVLQKKILDNLHNGFIHDLFVGDLVGNFFGYKGVLRLHQYLVRTRPVSRSV